MNTPVTFRDFDPSPAVQAHVNEHALKLQHEVGAFTSCRVTIGKTNRSHKHGDVFQVHVEVHVPSSTFVSERTSGEHDNLYATVDAAFHDLRERVRAHHVKARERRNEV